MMLTPNEFEECVRRATLWAQAREELVLREGLPLSEREQSIARQAGVHGIERVRLLPVTVMPRPSDPVLQSAMERTRFEIGDSHGLTLGHAILVLRPASTYEAWREEWLIAHELVHVAQVERLGLGEFLNQYIAQCLQLGYDAAPLELEARQFRFS
jgi:hypothetical protein